MYITIDDEEEYFIDAEYPELKKGLYKVSNYGNVYNTETKRLKYTPSRDQDGYIRQTFIGEDNEPIYIYNHRLVAYNFCDGYDEENGVDRVNHLDSIRDHNYYKNLVWSTTSENNKHGFEHGDMKPPIVHLHGDLNGNTKYPDSFAKEICEYLQAGYSVTSIMHEIGYKRCCDNLRLYDFIRYVKKRKYRTSVSCRFDF